jgi:hypothetical protein
VNARGTAGRCGEQTPEIVGGVAEYCALPAGHAGWHRGDQGAEWSPAESVIVRPGDTVIFRVNRHVTPKDIDEFKAQLEERLPGVNVIVVAADGLAIYRPEQPS